MKGIVRWFNLTKGYGFIIPEIPGKDIFLHCSSLDRAGIFTLSSGQKIEFDLEINMKGKRSASNLRRL